MRKTWMGAINIAMLLASCGQPPAAVVRKPPDLPDATPAPSQQDFSAARTLSPEPTAAGPTPAAVAATGDIPQFRSPEAQAAFETYLERYHQLMTPSQISKTEVIVPSQIQASLETIRQKVIAIKQAEANVTGVLSPGELRQFRAYQNQLANPP